ncbi:MAG: type II secretion system F family protein [Burkholderiales bacterium]
MPSFVYKGRKSGGELVQGAVEAANSSAAADQVLGLGLTPIEIAETGAKESAAPGIQWNQLFASKILALDVMMFSRQLYTLLKAGVPIMRALTGLQESSINPSMKQVIQDVKTSLDSGRELSLSFARHPKVFTPFYLSMVRVGEITGRLEDVFLNVFRHLEFEQFMREQVKSALRYPSFVVAAMAVAIVVINIFVIPAFAKVFAGFGAELPLMTRILVGFSNFMIAWWPAMLLGLVGGIFGFRNWTNTEIGRLRWDRMKLSIPVAGKIIQKATLARFARSFALAIKSGVPIVQAIGVVAQTVDNAYIAQKVEKMRDGIERGDSVLRTAAISQVFTPVVLQMIAVGEESGAIEEMMDEIAGMYQRDVEYELKMLGQQIEPILIVFLGVLVLILALGIFLPIWDLGRVALPK